MRWMEKRIAFGDCPTLASLEGGTHLMAGLAINLRSGDSRVQ